VKERSQVPPPSRSRRRPTQERAKATRNQILDAAAKLFGERGITDTSTNRIAAAAGVSIGTVYRYFSDRSVMVDELLDRLLIDIETAFTAAMFNLKDMPILDMYTTIFGVITDVLVANAGLVRALIAGVQFYSSGLPEFEPRLRLMIKVLVIQILGPGDDHKYDVMASVVVNTGFAVVLRASALDVDGRERRELIAATAEMIATWFEDHRASGRDLPC
jgi:AcrR family transcriptional regulator